MLEIKFKQLLNLGRSETHNRIKKQGVSIGKITNIRDKQCKRGECEISIKHHNLISYIRFL